MSDEAQTHTTTPPDAVAAPVPQVEQAAATLHEEVASHEVPQQEVSHEVSHVSHEVPQHDVSHEVAHAVPTDDTAHAAAAAAAEQQQPIWNPATGQYYYPGVTPQPGQDYLQTTDYNINGVMSLPTDHYVTATGEDYNNVAATLSNWAEANPTDDANGGLPLVPPPVNGDPNMAVHTNGEIPAAPAPIVPEKPKKLVLACHFCRGRKLK